jgi:hypothetical protein
MAQALRPNALGAALETLVVVLQSPLKRSSNQRGAYRGPYPYPPVLLALKPLYICQGRSGHGTILIEVVGLCGRTVLRKPNPPGRLSGLMREIYAS